MQTSLIAIKQASFFSGEKITVSRDADLRSKVLLRAVSLDSSTSKTNASTVTSEKFVLVREADRMVIDNTSKFDRITVSSILTWWWRHEQSNQVFEEIQVRGQIYLLATTITIQGKDCLGYLSLYKDGTLCL